MITFTKIGITVFALTALCGPLYTVNDYSIVSNVISELGAQHTQNNFIIIIGFILIGGGILIDGIKHFRVSLLPFIFFGLAMSIVGLFPNKPLDSSLSFNSTYHNLHGIIAILAGTAITVGFIWHGFITKGKQRIICFYLAGVSLGFPILMLSFPKYQGIIQRIMYLQILGWIWIKYPITLTNQALQLTAKGRGN